VVAAINVKRVFYIVGLALVIEGLFMLTGIPFSFYYRSGDVMVMLYSAMITSSAGGILWLLMREKEKKPIGRREGFMIVTLTWILMSAFGAIPFMMCGVPHGVLFWRSLTHWIGGMGIIVFTVALLSFLGAGGSQLFSAESSDPIREKLQPRIKDAAKTLWGIYLILTIAQTLMLLFGGMSLFDALCHTFGTVGTGGFSTRNASLAAFNPYCQYVVGVFMVLGATNFTLHYFLLTGKFRNFLKDQEFRLYMGIIIVSSIYIGLHLFFTTDYGVEKSLRHSFFQVASIISTSGFATDNYVLWPVPLIMVLFLLMFIGGSSGSTTGGMKVVRILVVLKAIKLEFLRILHPSAVIPLRLNGKPLKDGVVSNVLIFLFIYVGVFILSSLFLMISGVDFITAIGAVAATLGCVGPGLGEVGPIGNYSEIPLPSKWVLSFCMLVGRLELFSVLIVFSPFFWKN
jgi:trk system potassium uptake protein TrkH